MEEQMAAAGATAEERHNGLLTPEQVARKRHKESLQLSRTRVLKQLEQADNANYKKMLQSALADLDKQINKA